MQITAEISLYPLQDEYGKEILEFLEEFNKAESIEISTNAMSTLLTGEYDAVMHLITEKLKPVFDSHKAVFLLKLSNGCRVEM